MVLEEWPGSKAGSGEPPPRHREGRVGLQYSMVGIAGWCVRGQGGHEAQQALPHMDRDFASRDLVRKQGKESRDVHPMMK